MNLPEQYPARRCPVCDSIKPELLFEQRFQGISGTGLLEGYDVVACENCGAVYSDRIPPEERFGEYYSTASKYEFSHRGGEQHEEEIIRVEELAKWLSKRLPLDLPILDVGCATGELLLKLRAEGFSDIYGLDPSRECVERAQKLHGLAMIQGVLGAKSKDQRAFGAVILSAVLEHIPDTEQFIDDLNQWIRPNGYLIVEVPDLQFFDKSRNAPYQELSIEHINFFTAESLKNLMGRFGLALIEERHFMCAAAGGLTGAGITMLFQKGFPAEPIEYENISKQSMEKYLKECDEIGKNESRIIGSLQESQQEIMVWGTGTLCRRLLAYGGLEDVNVSSFIDSNPHYHGKMLAGHPIIKPKEISSLNPILIASWGFQDEITATIRLELGLANQLITFR